MDHGRVLLRLEARHETVEDFLARGRGRGLGAVDLAQHLDGGLGDVRPLARPVQLHELRHGSGLGSDSHVPWQKPWKTVDTSRRLKV